MGFEDLVSDNPPPSREELERLNRVIREYETENLRLRDERDVAKQTYEGVLEGKEERQKEMNKLHKKINSLKQQLTIEKKASDGLTKKAGMLDIDLKLHKEERQSLIEEQIMNRRKVADLDRKLLDDRAKRLRNIHENDLMRKKNLELEARNKICEADTRKASEDLLVKIQKLQSASELVEKQRRTIEAQGAEMLELNRELTTLKETMKSMTDDFLKLERRAALMKKERDEFENENFRLRREMVSTSSSTSRRAAAFDGYRPGSKQSPQRASTSIGGSRGGSSYLHGEKPSTSSGFARMHSFQFADFEERSYRQSQQSLSPPSGSYRGTSPERAATTGQGSRRRNGSVSFDRGDTMSQGSIGAEMSQVTIDSGIEEAEADVTVRERYIQTSSQGPALIKGHTELKGNPEGPEDLEEKPDAFADTSLSLKESSDVVNSNSAFSADEKGVKSSKKSSKKGLTIDSGSYSTMLRPLTGTSPVPSPMGSPAPRGPLTAAGVLSPVLSRPHNGDSQHNANRVKKGILTSQPRGKLHERGKTGFVGQGLGLVASPTPSYSAGGSAKQVLARILAET